MAMHDDRFPFTKGFRDARCTKSYIFSSLAFFCGLDKNRYGEYPRRKWAWSARFISFDPLERGARGREKRN
jgi:hypothetical protein